MIDFDFDINQANIAWTLMWLVGALRVYKNCYNNIRRRQKCIEIKETKDAITAITWLVIQTAGNSLLATFMVAGGICAILMVDVNTVRNLLFAAGLCFVCIKFIDAHFMKEIS